jgi:hypothetical protein
MAGSTGMAPLMVGSRLIIDKIALVVADQRRSG